MILLAMAAAAAALKPIELNTVANVQIGASLETVTAAWKGTGAITVKAEGRGATSIKAGKFTGTLCQGKLVSVSADMSEDFNEFAQLSEILLKANGPSNTPDIFAINGERPATDPRGAATIHLSVIRLTWRAYPHFLLGYSELNGERRVFESLNIDNPCMQKPAK